MTNDKYKETKECACICCGTMVTVTKFASAAKVVCDDCKKSNAAPNADILQTIKPKAVVQRSQYDGATKELPCTKCGAMVTVTKFASAAKVLCDDCRGDGSGYTTGGGMIAIKVDMKKLDRKVIPPIEQYTAIPQLIGNNKLRNVECPACGHHHMTLLKVLDWSEFGIIAHYQCHKCKLLMSISEQSKQIVQSYKDGSFYDYSGNEIEQSGMSAVDGSRMSTTIQKLMKILNEHNIKVDGIELPPYTCEEKRPVPFGYVIPDNERNIKAVEIAIKLLNDSERQGEALDIPEGARYITISDTIAKDVAGKLKLLFKGDE